MARVKDKKYAKTIRGIRETNCFFHDAGSHDRADGGSALPDPNLTPSNAESTQPGSLPPPYYNEEVAPEKLNFASLIPNTSLIGIEAPPLNGRAQRRYFSLSLPIVRKRPNDETGKVITNAETALDTLWPVEYNRQKFGIPVENCILFKDKDLTSLTSDEIVDTYFGNMKDIEEWATHARQCLSACKWFLDHESTRPRFRIPHVALAKFSPSGTKYGPPVGWSAADDKAEEDADGQTVPELGWPTMDDPYPPFHAYGQTGRRGPPLPPKVQPHGQRMLHAPRAYELEPRGYSENVEEGTVDAEIGHAETTKSYTGGSGAGDAKTREPETGDAETTISSLNAAPAAARTIMGTMQWAQHEVALVSCCKPPDDDFDPRAAM